MSGCEHSARADPGGAVDLREADSRRARDLPCPTLAAKLRHDLEHLSQARRADRLAVRKTAAVGVDGEAPADARRARGVQRRLLAMLTEPTFGQVDQLRSLIGAIILLVIYHLIRRNSPT